MSKVKFYLKNPKQEQSLIFAVLHFDYYILDRNNKKIFKRLKYSTGENVKTSFWNPTTQRAKETKKFPEYSEFNTKLDGIQADILNAYRKLENDKNTPNLELLKSEIDKIRKPSPIEYMPNMFTFIEDFIEKTKYVTKNNKPVQINERTKQKYRTTLKILKDFAKIQKDKTLEFENIDMDFYYKFLEYLQDTKNYEINTCGKHIATLKKFMNVATERCVNRNLTYKKFASLSEVTDKIYLTESELGKIYNLDLTNNKRLDRVRDLFLIGCYTALRFGDFTNIKPENIYNNDKGTFIKINDTQKTGAQVIIPLHWIVKEILNKYNNNLPRAISNQKMNDYLKEIGENAEIKDLLPNPKKNDEKKDPIYKYQLISTHTARRTGATNMYLNGIPAHSIMRITGHKTEKVFLTYLRFSNEDNANLLVESPFFQPKPILKVV